jgi:hypothetical protein
MKQLMLLSILSVKLCNHVYAQSPERYTGIFVNTEIGLTISVTKKGEQYTGSFEYQKKRYPFKGVKTLGIMDAEYEYNGAKIPFTLSYLFGSYYVSSEGINMVMERKSAVAAVNDTKQPAPPPTQGQVHTSVQPLTGKRVTDPYSGYSFQLPAGWNYNQNNGAFLLTKNSEKVQLSVGPHNYKTKDDVTRQLQDVSDPNTDTYLHATIKESTAKQLLIHSEGRLNGNDMIIETCVSFSPYSTGVSITAAAETAAYLPQYTQLVRSIAGSVRYTKPIVSAAAREWTTILSGRQLIYLSTSGGGSQKIVINLYRDGRFTHSNNSSYLSGGSSTLSYSGASGDEGSWKIHSRGNEVLLTLYGNDGSSREYVISQGNERGEIHLDNRRYFLKTLD